MQTRPWSVWGRFWCVVTNPFAMLECDQVLAMGSKPLFIVSMAATPPLALYRRATPAAVSVYGANDQLATLMRWEVLVVIQKFLAALGCKGRVVHWGVRKTTAIISQQHKKNLPLYSYITCRQKIIVECDHVICESCKSKTIIQCFA